MMQEAKEGTYKEIYKGINRRKNLNVNNYEDGLTMAKNSRYAYIAEKSYLDIKGNSRAKMGQNFLLLFLFLLLLLLLLFLFLLLLLFLFLLLLLLLLLFLFRCVLASL